jgi:hypothetical protein
LATTIKGLIHFGFSNTARTHFPKGIEQIKQGVEYVEVLKGLPVILNGLSKSSNLLESVFLLIAWYRLLKLKEYSNADLVRLEEAGEK